jgi:RluA family pseudouridine synthase
MMKRPLLEVMAEEFNVNDISYYRAAIADGRITVNGAPAKPDVLLKGHDVIHHLIHRHEPPVLAEPVAIVAETDDYVAVNKPASVPVHPTGRYRANTLIEILAHEHGRLSKLYPGNRLDRLTSGILVLGKTPQFARQFATLIQTDGAVRKEYVALVHGVFPEEPLVVDKPIAVYGRHGGGVCRVDEADPDSKPSVSEFRRIWADEHRKVSLVQCVPRTGRTHQLRVHLSFLGHGIVSDPLYGADARNAQVAVTDSLGNTVEDYQKAAVDKAACPECGEPLYEDPALYRIHLHALRYSCAQFDVSAPLPAWAVRENT